MEYLTCLTVKTFRMHLTLWTSLLLIHLGHTGQVLEVGNQLIKSNRGVEDAGRTFLMNQPMPSGGIIIAFNAIFRNANPAVIQVWRPEDLGSTERFLLVSQVTLQPKAIGEPVKLNWTAFNPGGVSPCLKVEGGDRLGFLVEVAPSSMTYEWDLNKASVMVYATPANSPYPTPGTVVSFDTLNFPYYFALSADVDIGTQMNNSGSFITPSCSEALLGYTGSATAPPPATAAPTHIPGPPGPQGLPGPEGPEGQRGPDGPVGPPGLKGERGQIGLVGPQGSDGQNGPYGPTGDIGPAGFQGVQGLQGVAGSPGIPGEAGNPGQMGNRGPTGPMGPNGPPGTPGQKDRGLTGPRGDRGARGSEGLTGLPGADGRPGAPGVNGSRGETGPVGPSGAVGPAGSPGLRGLAGPPGPPGSSGTSGLSGPDAGASAGASTGDSGSSGVVSNTLLGMIILWNFLISFAFIVLCIILFRQKKIPSARVGIIPCLSDKDVGPDVVPDENGYKAPTHVTFDRPISAIDYRETPTSLPYAQQREMTESFDYQRMVHDQDTDEEILQNKMSNQRPFSRAQRSSTRMADHGEEALHQMEEVQRDQDEQFESDRRSGQNSEEKRRRKKKRRSQTPNGGADLTMSASRTMEASVLTTRHVDLVNKTGVSYSDEALDNSDDRSRDSRAGGASTDMDVEKGSERFFKGIRKIPKD